LILQRFFHEEGDEDKGLLALSQTKGNTVFFGQLFPIFALKRPTTRTKSFQGSKLTRVKF